MSYHQEKILKFKIGLSHSIERAKKLLEAFDEGKYECLFYAALELRMGLEGRLYAYIRASDNSNNKVLKRIKECSATKLLKMLSEIDPNALIPSDLAIYPKGESSGFLKKFVPITKKHVEYYGKLNAMLHFKFFKDNDFWFLKDRLNNKSHSKTLLDYRDFLREVLSELEKLSQGTLNAHPSIRFDRILKEMDNKNNLGED